ncbi:MAG TPA: HAMP domain-containing protein, partial [Leptospiraceae bacterium]|nr:HAMP domain-containing protein [Leptospiraceae bacterium]
LKNLKITHRLLILIVVFTIPLGVLAFLEISSLVEVIHFKRLRRTAFVMMHPMIDARTKINFRRGIMALVARGEGSKDLLPDVDRFIDDQMEEENKLITQYGDIFETKKAYVEARQAWEKLKQAGTGQSLESSYRSHTELSLALLAISRTYGSASTLDLEEEGMLYYPMWISTSEVPRIYDNMFQLMSRTFDAVEDDKVDSFERASLRELVVNLEESRDALKAELKTTDENYPGYLSRVSNKFQESEKRQDELANFVRRNVLEGDGKVDRKMMIAYASAAADKLEAFHDENGLALKEGYDTLERKKQYLLALLIALISTAMGVALFLGYLTTRNLSRSLGYVIQNMDSIGSGKLDNQIDAQSKDEIGTILKYLASMQSNLRGTLEENLRVRTAVDNSSTMVMIADTNRAIVYTNNAMEEFFRKAEKDIQKDIPSFDRNRVLGMKFDQFSTKGTSLTDLERSEVPLGGHILRVSTSAIVNVIGERLGTVLEWTDRTNEVHAEQEIESLVSAAVRGDFAMRMDLQGKQGFFRKLGAEINNLMQVSASGLADVARVLGAMAEGNLTERITADYSGTFAELKDFSNNTATRLAEIIARVRESAETLASASEEVSATAQSLSQGSSEQAASVEETGSSLEEMSATISQNADNARTTNEIANRTS